MIIRSSVIAGLLLLLSACGGGREAGDGVCAYDCSVLDPFNGSTLDFRNYPNKTLEWCVVNRNDCSATFNGQDLSAYHVYYADRDGDGFGDKDMLRVSDVFPLPGWARQAGDCDDGNAAVHPLADEIVDGVDNNCDGRVDDVDLTPPGRPALVLEGHSLNTAYLRLEPAGDGEDVVRCELSVDDGLLSNLPASRCRGSRAHVTTRDEPRRRCYTLVAFDAAGNRSEPSEPVCVTYPEAPIDWEIVLPATETVYAKRLAAGDRLVLVLTRSGLRAYATDGTLAWRRDFAAPSNVARVAELADRILLLQAGRLEALDATGAPLWHYDYAEGAGARNDTRQLATDGRLVLLSTGDALHALDPDGGLLWKAALDAPLDRPPVFGGDGNVYLSSGGALVSLARDSGELRWRLPLGLEARQRLVPLDGVIIAGPVGDARSAAGRHLYGIDYAGEQAWALSSWARAAQAGPPGSGRVYLGEGRDTGSRLRAVDAAGEVLWEHLGCCNGFFVTAGGFVAGYTVDAAGRQVAQVLDGDGRLRASLPRWGRGLALYSPLMGSPLAPETTLGGIGEIDLDGGGVLWHYAGYDQPVFDAAGTRAYLSARPPTGDRRYRLVAFDLVKARALAAP